MESLKFVKGFTRIRKVRAFFIQGRDLKREKCACYISEVFTFMALILISCDSLALSSQTTCFYIDKNLISD